MARPDKDLDLSAPFWADCRAQLGELLGNGFPTVDDLNRLLQPGRVNSNGLAIRFVSSEHLPAVQYEQYIFERGEIPTRPDNWHDLFNALAWMQFPATKSALNARHCAEIKVPQPVNRSRQRDALTLFDECGAIVVAADPASLEAITSHRWNTLFAADQGRWTDRFRVLVAGHAMREKLLAPYKSITANVLLVRTSETLLGKPMAELRAILDGMLGNLLLTGNLLCAPQELAPLPLMGIPGWWTGGEQNQRFYADETVFRPQAKRRKPAKFLQLE